MNLDITMSLVITIGYDDHVMEPSIEKPCYNRPRLIFTIITGGLYYPQFLFRKKSKFVYKVDLINRVDIIHIYI